MARPFLKWVGGKTGLLPELLKYVPKDFGTYYEPFLGGGALFFELQSLGLLKHGAVLSDVNADLVNCYVQVRDNIKYVLGELRRHAQRHSEAHFLAVRQEVGVLYGGDTAYQAAAFIYLNKTGFNGLWRVNRAGKCNTPWGKHESFTPDEENLRACSVALQGVDLRCQNFLASPFDYLESGALIYADPPYFPASKTANFVGYAKGGFGPQEQALLAARLYMAQENSMYVVASNADVPECRQLYGGFEMHEVQARRAVNCKGGKRGKVGELIITNAEER